jgi:hypothetical protein
MPGYYPTHVTLAAVAGQLGRLDIGRSAIDELLALYPEFAERGYAEYTKWYHDDRLLESIFEGLRLAGLEVADFAGTKQEADPQQLVHEDSIRAIDEH